MSCKLHPWFMPTARRRQKPHPRFKPSVRYHNLLPNELPQPQPRFTPSFRHPYSSQAPPSEIPMGTLQTSPTGYRYPTRPGSLTSLTPRRSPLAAASAPLPDEYPHTPATTQHSLTPALKLLLASPTLTHPLSPAASISAGTAQGLLNLVLGKSSRR